MIKVNEVFWAVMLYSVAVWCWHFGGPCSLHLQVEMKGAGKEMLILDTEHKRGQ